MITDTWQRPCGCSVECESADGVKTASITLTVCEDPLCGALCELPDWLLQFPGLRIVGLDFQTTAEAAIDRYDPLFAKLARE